MTRLGSPGCLEGKNRKSAIMVGRVRDVKMLGVGIGGNKKRRGEERIEEEEGRGKERRNRGEINEGEIKGRKRRRGGKKRVIK